MQLTEGIAAWIQTPHNVPGAAVEVLNQSTFDKLWTVWILCPADGPYVVCRYRGHAEEFIVDLGCSAYIGTNGFLPVAGGSRYYIRTTWKRFETPGCGSASSLGATCNLIKVDSSRRERGE